MPGLEINTGSDTLLIHVSLAIIHIYQINVFYDFDTRGHNCISDIYKNILARFTFSWSFARVGQRGRWAEEEGLGIDPQVLIAHGGSSSPGLCTSHTDAAGAPCSGPRHPGHQASPEDAVCEGTR